MGAVGCQRCLLDSKCLNIGFDRDGVCNFCRTYERHQGGLTDYPRLRNLLADRFERFRGKGEYDCLVGLSGGKDSSYVAHSLKKEFGVRVLLVTFDNGFLSDYGRRNVSRMVERLGMDHLFHQPDPDVQRALLRSSVRKFSVPCPSCAFPMISLMMRIAFEKRIPFVVHGRSRAQIFKELTDGAIDPFLPLCLNSLEPYDVEANKAMIRRSSRRLIKLFRFFVKDPVLLEKIAASYYPPVERFADAAYYPEPVAFFLSRPYDEREFMSVLERELDWERPEEEDILGHRDCLAHHAATYLYARAYGYPMIAQELSVMIREGDIDKPGALERLRAEHWLDHYPAESLKSLAEVTGFSEDFLVSNTGRVARRLNLLKLGLRVRNRLLGRAPVLPAPA